MKLIFLGPPGAGKGTQAIKIAQMFQIAHISTGDMLRAEMREGTKLGNEAKSLMDRGELVPDDVILGMVKNRIQKEDCKNGFLFDGFPRTIAQAEALEEISAIDYVINLDVPAETLIRRISGRRMCAECGAGYHVSTYTDTNCKCGGALYQREDDKEETVRNRLVVYERSTKPLIDYYTKKGLLHTVNGNAEIDAVDAAIRSVLSK
jgi:adenylate kinase